MSVRDGRRGIVSRGDLLAVLQCGDGAALQLFCELLDLKTRPLKCESAETGGGVSEGGRSPQMRREELSTAGYPSQAAPLQLWHCVREVRTQSGPAARGYGEWKGWSAASLSAADLCQPLEPWSSLEPRLRLLLNQSQTATIDVERLVDRVARRQPVCRLPRVRRRQWGGPLFVVRDSSLRLVPLERDQREVIMELRRLLPPGEFWHVQGVSPAMLWYDGKDHGDLAGAGAGAEFRHPDRQSTLLVLGDLGAFDGSGEAAAAWLRWGRGMVADGHRLLALVPCAEHRIARGLRELFAVRTWQPSTKIVDDPVQRAALLRQLAVAVSPAIRLEPGLLRDLRQEVLASADASLELDYWNSDWMQFQHPRAGTPHRPTSVEELLPLFEGRDAAERKRVLECIRRWRQTRRECAEIWFEELLSLSRPTRELLENDDCEQALSLLADFRSHVAAETQRGRQVRSWLHSALRRYPASAFLDTESGPLLQPLYAELIGDQRRPVEPRYLPARGQRRFVIRQTGEHLLVEAEDTSPTLRARVAEFESRTWAVQVEQADGSDTWKVETLPAVISVVGRQCVRLKGELHEARLERCPKPAWAAAVGCDRFGIWGELAIGAMVGGQIRRQRLRWIPSGEYWMGSPEDEVGRFKNEVRHRVEISAGYWMFDSACPQWLWEKVMGRNPSRFVDPERPVERVSWKQCVGFLGRLNEYFGGTAGFRLPTEAEWEYACRAGTETALYTGGLTLRGKHDGAELDEIAWYGGNSGVDYDLVKSYDGSGWPEKQHDFRDCGSRRVRSKRCNAWGLYDMLGNVWEWCSDFYGEYELSIREDPQGARRGSVRVVRGGSWASNARRVRAACRAGYVSGSSYSLLGMRPVSAVMGEVKSVDAGH